MPDEPKRVPEAQEAIRRSMEAASPPAVPSARPVAAPPRATSGITQSLTDMREAALRVEERLFGGVGTVPSDLGRSVHESLADHIRWLQNLLGRL